MADRFLYFAYGSNMLTRRLRAPSRAPSAQVIGTGYVTGHRLTFDKASEDKERRRSGKCDMAATGVPTDCVWGVLFSVDTADQDKLDTAEGARGTNPGYEHSDVSVTLDDGSRQTAMTYKALRKDPALRPYHWYKALVAAGAVEHQLPSAYIEWLLTFESQADPDQERRGREDMLLFEANRSGPDSRG
jgi:AIG2-like family